MKILIYLDDLQAKKKQVLIAGYSYTSCDNLRLKFRDTTNEELKFLKFVEWHFFTLRLTFRNIFKAFPYRLIDPIYAEETLFAKMYVNDSFSFEYLTGAV